MSYLHYFKMEMLKMINNILIDNNSLAIKLKLVQEERDRLVGEVDRLNKENQALKEGLDWLKQEVQSIWDNAESETAKNGK